MAACHDRLEMGEGHSLMSVWLVTIVGAGGALGALMRYGVGRLVVAKRKPSFYGTLIVNLVGSFVMGVFIGIHLEQEYQSVYAFMGIGILGGLTTYSTLNVQKAMMSHKQSRRVLVLYLGATYVGGLILTAAGVLLGYVLHT
jgi:CrcB protein